MLDYYTKPRVRYTVKGMPGIGWVCPETASGDVVRREAKEAFPNDTDKQIEARIERKPL